MKTLKNLTITTALVFAVLLFTQPVSAGGADSKRLDSIEREFGPVLSLSGTPAAKEINAIANLIMPGSGMMTIDLKHASGELCMLEPDTKRNMVHFSPNPEETKEDIIYFINPTDLKAAGLRVKELPKLPGELNRMEPLKWYYYDGKTKEPHHGRRLGSDFLVMAIDVK